MTHLFKGKLYPRRLKYIAEAIEKPWLNIRPFIERDSKESQLPEEYKKFYWEWRHAPKKPVHHIAEEGTFKKLPDGQIVPVQNIPISLKYPREMHQGIWGGEAVVKGYRLPKENRRPMPKYWFPVLKETVLYSEVLDRRMSVIVTERALDLIDENYGLDFYLLKTSAADLVSMLALKLKREILTALNSKSLYPNDPEKREEIYDKYRQYMIPDNELKWYALTMEEALAIMEREKEASSQIIPLKQIFRQQLLDHLKENKDLPLEDSVKKDSSSGWMSKLNFFSKK